MKGGAAADRSQFGFTLIELLVAITLLGMLYVLLFGGLRLGARAWERTASQAGATEEIETARNFLRSSLAQAFPLYVQVSPTQADFAFAGKSDWLTFLAPAPPSLGGAGLARIELRAVRRGEAFDLVTTVMPELASSSTAQIDAVLIHGIRSFKVSYYGVVDASRLPRWVSDWTVLTALPQLIRIDVGFGRGDPRRWSDLVVASQIAIDTNCVYDPLTKRCRGR